MPTDPNAASRHHAYRLAYEQWFQTLPPEERDRLAKLGLDKPEKEQFGPVVEGDEHNDPTEWFQPPAAIEGTPEDETALGAAFASALAWCVKGTNLADMGRRLLLVLHIWRPSLVAGITLEIERELRAEFDRDVGPGSGGGALGPVLEWARRGTSLGQIGQRLLAMAYVLNPALIAGRTLAAIGALTNKTRQAVDKLVGDFRDTFGGLRSRTMRDEINRITCRKAQLLKA